MKKWDIEGLEQLIREEEEGVALTEFVITLPIFMILMSGLMTLGHLGVSSVAVKNAAYAEMWQNVAYQTTENPAAMTPRSKLDNPLEQIGSEVGGSALANFLDGIPFWSPDIEIPGASGEGANAAIGLGGHWGEAEYYATTANDITGSLVDHRDDNTRLQALPTGYSDITKHIIGPDGDTKPRLGLDDNLTSNATFDGFHIDDIFAGDGLLDVFSNIGSITSDGVQDIIFDAISGTGLAPGLMAGTRYGRGVGVATNEMELGYPMMDTSVEHSAMYMTAPAPYTDGVLNNEKWHWLFYVGGTQPVHNQRHMLNLVSSNLDDGTVFTTPTIYGN